MNMPVPAPVTVSVELPAIEGAQLPACVTVTLPARSGPRQRLSDTQRVELGLPANMMLCVLKAGAEVRTPPKPGRLKILKRVPCPYHPYEDRLYRKQRRRETFEYRRDAYLTFIECLAYLEYADREAWSDLWGKQYDAKRRRLARVHYHLIAPHIEAEAKVSKIGLMAFYLLQILVDEKWVVVPEDSALQRGLDLLLPGLEHVAAIQPLDNSAQKQARRAFKTLQEWGYYVDR